MGRTATAADIGQFMKEGFQFFQASPELAFMAAGARPILQAVGKAAGPAEPPKDKPIY